MTNLQISDEKYNELHLFIDESGKLNSNRRNEIRFVGGVLIFGEYNSAIEKSIEYSLRRAVKEIGRKYPQDLHYFQLPPNERKKLAYVIQKQLAFFRPQFGERMYGVLIQHDEDIYPDAPIALAEQELDNRYNSMLWSLIEYYVFVSDEVNKRLTNNAAIHLHIAKKSFSLPEDEDYINTVKSLGYNVSKNPQTGQHYVQTSINAQTIRGMFTMTIRNRWKTSQRELASIEINSINYDCNSYANDSKRRTVSTPTIYLADIILGVERNRIIDERIGIKPLQQILPFLEFLEYGKQLEVAVQCKACLLENQFEALVEILADESIDPDDIRNQDVMNRLVEEFKQNPTSFHSLIEIAVREIDEPKRRSHALMTAKLVSVIYQRANVFDLLIELYSILVSFAAANHTGDIIKAEAMWNQYLELEKQTPAIGKEYGLEKVRDIILMFRSRRAVNLMDKFNFEAAENVIVEVSKDEINFRGNNADDLEFISKRRIGICYSLAGQACAFQRKQDKANEFFNYALSCFTKPEDNERIWIYRGHLACDYPEVSTDIWKEIKERLLVDFNRRFEMLDNPFAFAILMKGTLVFGDINEKQEWLKEIDDVLEFYRQSMFSIHPCGLILQSAAMLYAAVWRETGDDNAVELADYYFQQAIGSLASGEKLLRLLSNACKLRHALFLYECNPHENKKSVELALRSFVNNASEFGLSFENLSPEETLSCLRFNYW
jgi:hypothetical protein